MSRLQSAREPINPKGQIQYPIGACAGERNDAQNLDAKSLTSPAHSTRPRATAADPFNRAPLLQNLGKSSSAKLVGIRNTRKIGVCRGGKYQQAIGMDARRRHDATAVNTAKMPLAAPWHGGSQYS